MGKVPARLAKTLERESALKTLQRDLRKAVADEDYESAASIRDQIRHYDVE
jgi:protein arginine kinase activator